VEVQDNCERSCSPPKIVNSTQVRKERQTSHPLRNLESDFFAFFSKIFRAFSLFGRLNSFLIPPMMHIAPRSLLFGLMAATLAVAVPVDPWDTGKLVTVPPPVPAPLPQHRVTLLGHIDSPLESDTNVQKIGYHLSADALSTLSPHVNHSMTTSIQAFNSGDVESPNQRISALFKAAAPKLSLPADVLVTCTNNQQVVNDPKNLFIEFTITSKLGSGEKLAIEDKMPLNAMALGKTGTAKGSYIKGKDGKTLFAI